MKRNNKNELKHLRSIVYLVVVISVVAIFALIPKIFSSHDLLFQIIAVVLSVLFTAFVTNELLTGQSAKEEAREKNIKVHENKIAVYADFLSKMWATMNDDQIDPSEIVGIRSAVFNRLIFYLNDLQVKNILSAIEELKVDSATDQYIEAFQKITMILRDDIMENASKSDGNDIMTLWNRFNDLLPKLDEEESIPVPEVKDGIQDPNVEAEKPIIANKRINSACVHFNMLSPAWQYQIFDNGVQALALCEYGESWRTNQIKRCGFNDVIFLYRTGGPGYVGVFLAKGWIVFDADGRGNLTNVEECVLSETANDTTSVPKEEWHKKIALYDAQERINDGCTLVSYLIVDPLIYYEGGVGYISIYRKTISSYYNGYAWTTLARFKFILDSKPKEEINTYSYNNEIKPIRTNEDALKQLIADNNVVSSKWDSKQGWIDK